MCMHIHVCVYIYASFSLAFKIKYLKVIANQKSYIEVVGV